MSGKAAVLAAKHRLKPAGRGYIGDCPGCGYSGALSLSDGENGRLLLFCHAGCDFKVIARALGEVRLSGSSDRPITRQRLKSLSASDRDAFIRRLVTESMPARDGFVRTYLAGRGIRIAPPPDLRCLVRHRHAPSRKVFPTMLGLVRNLAGQVTGLHRTYLSTDGATKADVEPAKMSFGSLQGCAVHLHDRHVDLNSLAVSEGIETGLSVAEATGMPVWAALSAGGVAGLILPPLPKAREVLIFADRDLHGRGQRAAEAAAQRFVIEGRRVQIVLPPEVDTDFNDMLQAAK